MAAKKYQVIIIGGGPGGYAAALYCARAGLKTVVLEKLSPGGQMATTDKVENYPGFETSIEGFDLGSKMAAGAERFGAETELTEVTSVDLIGREKTVHTDDGDFTAPAVILALGAAPRELGLPEERNLWGRGVSYCATCDGNLYKGQEVAIVGGGNTAVEEALFLSKICKHVTLIHRRDKLAAQQVMIVSLLNAKNVTILYDTSVAAIHAGKKVDRLTLKNLKDGSTKELPVQGLFVAIGRNPTTEMFKGLLQLDKQGYIKADETTRTSLPGVFAVGDIRTKALRQIITAAADGAVASKFAEEYLNTL